MLRRLCILRTSSLSSAVLFSSSSPEAVTVAPDDIIEPANSLDGRLMAPRTPHERTRGEVSWRTMRAREHFFEVPVRQRAIHGWQRARENWYQVETKLIWAAFDAPEKIPVLLRDEVIRGHHEVFEDPRWLERALYWVKEARYWRSIGIMRPFYDKDTLRAYAWDEKGQAFGQPVINSAMRDAISDLERARKRKEAGLDPNYIWDRWGPSGFVDGMRSDYLPRFEKNPVVDPDGIEVEDDELSAITSHEQIRDRYGGFIWGDEEPFEHSFNVFASSSSATATSQQDDAALAASSSNLTNAYLELHDFSDDVRRLYCELSLGPAPSPETAGLAEVAAYEARADELVQGADDIRALVYVSAQPLDEVQAKFGEWLQEREQQEGGRNDNQQQSQQKEDDNSSSDKWDLFKRFLQPQRDACDVKVDACRLLHWSSRDVDQAREFFQEKCGFVDFMMTSDKVLTAASACQLRAIRAVASNTEWGLPLCLALTDKEKADAIGLEAFAVWRELEDLCVDRRRRMFTQRFTEPAHEEKTLDFLLAHFTRRTERTDVDKAALGAEFDREQEPIGRTVQRRVLVSDLVRQPGVQKSAGPAGDRFANFRKSRAAKAASTTAYDKLLSNQLSSQPGLQRGF